MGGPQAATSELGKGSVFTMRLPGGAPLPHSLILNLILLVVLLVAVLYLVARSITRPLSELARAMTRFPQVLLNFAVAKKRPFEEMPAVQKVIAAYQQIITRAHAHGIRVIGATITPYMGSDYYHPDALNEADRQTVNEWIRGAGHFDAVIDCDAVVRDPHQLDRLLPAYDCGDHLHPSPAGYRAMGEAIPLSLFAR